jgi:hypothetical protein
MYFENTAWGMHAMDNGTTYIARDVSYTLQMFMKCTKEVKEEEFKRRRNSI